MFVLITRAHFFITISLYANILFVHIHFMRQPHLQFQDRMFNSFPFQTLDQYTIHPSASNYGFQQPLFLRIVHHTKRDYKFQISCFEFCCVHPLCTLMSKILANATHCCRQSQQKWCLLLTW